MGKNGQLKTNFLLIIILTLSGSFIYTLPYLRLYYYASFMEVFRMTNREMGMCATYFGLFGAVSYLIGGVIADKISLKLLIPFSLITTGLGGFYLLASPSPSRIAIIHGVWGVTSLMTFWPALIKALRMAASSTEQAKVFGLFEGGRGISNAVYLAIALMLFGVLGSRGGISLGIRSIIVFYSTITVTLGIISTFLLRGLKEGKGEENSKFSFKYVGIILKKPATWLLTGIIFTTYSVNMSYYYIAPYTSMAFVTSALVAAAISSSSQYIRPFAAFGAGILGDRVNSSKVMLTAQIMSGVGIVTVLLTPASSTIIPILLACVIIYASMYMSQSMHFAIMEEADFPPESSGTAIGLLCCFGYLPEAFSPYLAGVILDAHEGLAGYRIFFVTLLVTTLIGIGFTLIWIRMTRKRRNELKQIADAKKAIVLEPGLNDLVL